MCSHEKPQAYPVTEISVFVTQKWIGNFLYEHSSPGNLDETFYKNSFAFVTYRPNWHNLCLASISALEVCKLNLFGKLQEPTKLRQPRTTIPVTRLIRWGPKRKSDYLQSSQIDASFLSVSAMLVLIPKASPLTADFWSLLFFIDRLLVVYVHARMIQESDLCCTSSMFTFKIDVSITYEIELRFLRICIISHNHNWFNKTLMYGYPLFYPWKSPIVEISIWCEWFEFGVSD